MNKEQILQLIEQELIQADEAQTDTEFEKHMYACLLYTSPSPRDRQKSRMPSSA